MVSLRYMITYLTSLFYRF